MSDVDMSDVLWARGPPPAEGFTATPPLQPPWSESLQDLASWCLPPQDEFILPDTTNQNEFNFSLEEDTKYNKYLCDVTPPLDMWEGETLSPGGGADKEVHYSGNVLVSRWGEPSSAEPLDQRYEEFGEIRPAVSPAKPVPPTPVPTRTIRPSLRLDVAAARAPPPSDQPAPSSLSINTPDVFNSLADESGFSLISFVCEGEEQNLLATEGSGGWSSEAKINSEAIHSDHDYTSSQVDVKEEIDDAMEVSEGQAASNEAGDDDSDWSPSRQPASTGRRRKSRSSNRPRHSPPAPLDRYRELRDRNNEASRRSRLNRKQREVDMLDLAASLAEGNAALKVKAVSLERKVKALRKILLKVVLEKK